MQKRRKGEPFAATRVPAGTDVDFGSLTRQLFANLREKGVDVATNHDVKKLKKQKDGSWQVSYRHIIGGTPGSINAKFVFVGAGGWALKLLQRSGIPEIKGYGVFPIGGQWLKTSNPALVAQHQAKVYSQASVGAPPMSVPHLDTRVLDGKRVILFGPFATFSTKFLKEGSYFDLLTSTTTSNVWPMVRVGVDQYPLIEYLAGQVMLSDEDRYQALREYFPDAKKNEWRLVQAGQRVQIIKRDAEKGGVLKLGTEVVSAKDGSIAALLGASPGASTAAPIMLTVLEKVFAKRVASPEWQAKIREIVPSYGTKLNDDPQRVQQTLAYTSEHLQLTPPPQIGTPAPAPAPAEAGTVKPVPDMAP